MSSVYSNYSGDSRRTPTAAVSVEQKIYQLAVHSDSSETISTTTLPPPKYIPRAPRIRILLAPYMSPYVVPVHKVRTWDALHRTIHNLFGDHVFQDSPRITDQEGQTIFPHEWKNLVQPNMTIIVDTCSFVPEDSPTMFQSPVPASRTYGGVRRHKTKNSNRSIDEKLAAYGKMESVTALILADRESQDSTFFNAEPISPISTEPVLNTRPMEPWEGWSKDSPQLPMNELKLKKSHDALKRQTSVTMFSGLKAENTKPPIINLTASKPEKMERKTSKRSLGLGRKTSKASLGIERKTSKRAAPSAIPLDRKPPKRVADTPMYPNIVATVDTFRPAPLEEPHAPSPPPKKSRWGKVSKTLLFVLSGGMSDPKPLPSRSPTIPPRPPRSAPSERPSPPRPSPPRLSHDAPRRTLSKRARAPPPPQSPRSRASSLPSPPIGLGLQNAAAFPARSSSLQTRNRAPNIPPRPAVPLGMTAQYVTPYLTKPQIHEMRFGGMENQEEEEVVKRTKGAYSVFPPRAGGRR